MEAKVGLTRAQIHVLGRMYEREDVLIVRHWKEQERVYFLFGGDCIRFDLWVSLRLGGYIESAPPQLGCQAYVLTGKGKALFADGAKPEASLVSPLPDLPPWRRSGGALHLKVGFERHLYMEEEETFLAWLSEVAGADSVYPCEDGTFDIVWDDLWHGVENVTWAVEGLNIVVSALRERGGGQ